MTIPEETLINFEKSYDQICEPSLDADFKLAVVTLLAHIAQTLGKDTDLE